MNDDPVTFRHNSYIGFRGEPTLGSLKQHLPSVTFHRMRAVVRRIRTIVLARAACATWIVLVAATLIGMVIDAQWLLSMSNRWLMSITIYVASLAVFAWCLLPRLLQLASPRWVARVIESAVPQVRHHLLSALDFAKDPILQSMSLANGAIASPFQINHNFEFINAFQIQVASRMESVAPHDVLKWRSIRGWILSGLLLATMVVGAMFIPQLSFAKRAGRVLLPSLNIGRLVAYELVIQSSASPWIEIRNDLFSVEARSVVGTPKSLELQIESEDGSIRTLQMQPNTDDANRFLRNLSIDSPNARLRVVAFDSASPWYSVELVDRPTLTPKSITLHYPEYANVPPLTVDDWNGTIQCVKGTRVEAVFESKAPIRSGELLFEKSMQSASALQGETEMPTNVTLNIKTNNHQSAEFNIWNSGRYVVSAIDDRTGKQSDTARSYSIDAPSDHPPLVAWKIDQPTRAKFIASHELANLVVEYADEFPLEKLQIQFSLDQAAWNSVDLELPAQESGTAQWTLDPLALGIQNSQLLQVRFVATDRKKQTTTSSATQWMVSNSYTSDERWALLDERFNSIASLRTLSQKWQDWMVASDDIWLKTQDKSLEHLQTLPFNRESFDELNTALTAIASQSKDFVEQDTSIDLALMLRRLALIDIPQLQSRIAAANAQTSSDDLKQIRDAAREISRSLQRSVKSAYQLFGEDMLIAANQDMSSIIDSQSNLQKTVEDLSGDQVRNRQAAIGTLLATLVERMLHFAGSFESPEQSAFILQLRNLRQTQSSISAATGRNLLQNNRYWQSNESQRWIGQILQQMQNYQRLHTMQDGFYGQHRENRKALNPQSANWLQSLSQIRQQIDRIAAEANLPARLTKIVDYQRNVESLESLLAETRALEAIRTNLDRFYLSDTGNIRRAILNVTREEFGEFKDQLSAIDEITKASEVLAIAHRMKVAKDETQSILQIESDLQSLDAVMRAEQPRNMTDLSYHVELSRERSHQLQLSESIRKAWDKSSWGPTLQVINDSMNNRRWSRDPIQRVAASLREMLDTMEGALLDFDPQIIAARRTIDKYVPRVSELAKSASKKVDEAKKSVSQPAKEELKQKQEAATKSIDTLKQSLQDLASVQDLLSKEQAQLARDADRAIQALDGATKKASSAMDQLQQQGASASPAAEQAAVQAQEMVKDVLDKVSDHFQQVEQGQQPSQPFSPGSKSDDDDPQTAQQEAPQPQLEEEEKEDAYKEAEFLRGLSNMSPEALLKQLETELAKRPAMQNSLQQINLQNLQQTISTISSVSNRQRSLTRELELSDPLAQAQIDTSVEQMHQIARMLHKLNDQQVNWVLQSTGRAQLDRVQESMNSAKGDLTDLANKFSSVNADKTMFELKDLVQDLKNKTQKLKEKLSEVSTSVNQTETKAVASDERQLQNLQREANDWQTRYRRDNENWLQGEVRHRSNHQQHQNQQVQNRERLLEEAKKRLNNHQTELDKSPDKQHLRDNVKRGEMDVQFEQRELEATKLRSQSATHMTDRANELYEAAKSTNAGELPPNNPHLGLAKDFSGQSSSYVDEIFKDVDKLSQQVDAFTPPQPRSENARSVAERESVLVDDIQRTSRDMNRSGRHSQRVKNESDFQQLSELATQTEQISTQQMAQSSKALHQAASPPAPNQIPPARVEGPVAQTAVDQMRQSQQELNKVQNKINKVTKDLQQEIDDSPDIKPTPPPDPMSKPFNSNMFAPNFADFMSEPEMARLLDDLDHIVYDTKRAQSQQGDQAKQDSSADQNQQDAPGQKSSKQSQESGGQSQSSSKGQEAVQSAADKLADMLAQMRSMTEEQSNNPSQQNSKQSKSQQSSSAKSKSMSTSPAAGDVETPESASGEAADPAAYGDGIRLNKDWANLRVSKLEDGTGQSRQSSNSTYQSSIDAYFRALSKLRSKP